MNVMQLFLKRYKRKVSKVIKGGGVLSILFAFFISLVIPPFNIYADTITTSNIIGADRILVSSDIYDSDSSYNYWNVAYNIEVKLDKSYLGWVNCSVTQQYNQSSLNGNNYQTEYKTITTASRTYYVNGNSFIVPIIIQTRSPSGIATQNNDPANYFNPSVTLNSSNVTEMASLQTLEDIYNVLEDIKTLVDIDIMDELTNIVNELGISNQYLNTLTKIRQWNIPIESFFINYNALVYKSSGVSFVENSYNYLNYPVYYIHTNDRIHSINLYKTTFVWIFASGSFMNSGDAVLSNFNIDAISNSYSRRDERIGLGTTGFIYYIEFTPNSNNVIYDFISNSPMEYIPIYFGMKVKIKQISTDFALRYGLTNQLLDDLHIIAQGTTQSNTSSSSLETQKSSFDTTSNNLYNSENAFNTDMNNKLQSIDTSFNPSTSFGSKFLSSADWVRTQFNNLTSTSPFGTVLSFSMLLGLSLLIIGKVFK